VKSDRQLQHPSPGKLYGVGAGPGAPDLLTLRGKRVLQACPVICLPASASGKSYAGSIIENLIDHSCQEVLLMQFPMQRDQVQARPARECAANQVLERLSAGHDVAFVTEGDPLLYSTFGYVLEAVKRHDPTIPIEVVPGVSSITAAAAAAALPLAAWDERIAIIPAAYALTRTGPGDLRTLLQLFDTVVLLKVNTVFAALLYLLEELDLAQHAVFVRRCSTDLEEVVFDLARLRNQPLDYFSLVIVRNPHAISHT
jgi:precorrin-2/cobalt-factor-2 C20-methyltransferase